LVQTLANLQAEAGFLVLEVSNNESNQLIAQVGDERLVIEDVNPNAVVAVVHQLLHQTKILFETERAGL
jgi:hypothetical protein